MRKLKYQTSIKNENTVNEVKERNIEKTIYEVYWIHLKDHKDVLTQGYVGITCQGSRTRFYKHLSDARTEKYDYVLHRALRKYKNNSFVVDVLCICDEEYAKFLEYSLRPKDFIGWNTTSGGKGNPKILREITSTEEFSNNRSEYMNTAWADPEYREVMLNSRKRYYEETPAWRREGDAVNHFAWSMAGICYRLYKEYGWGNGKISGYLMTNSGSFCRVFDYFRSGWNPLEDEDYQELYPTISLSEIEDIYGPADQYHISWRRSGTSDTWQIADRLYGKWLKGFGVKDIAKESNVTWHQAHKIHKRFENGWNPNKDLRWLSDFKGYRHEYK